MLSTRILVVAGLATVTAAANAASFVFTGTHLGLSASPIQVSQVVSATGGAYLFDYGTFTYSTAGATSSGTILLWNNTGSITGNFTGNYSVNAPGKSFGGVVNFTSGTAGYLGYTGGGTFTTNVTNLYGNTDLSVFSVNADVASVPEPTTMAVLGLGAVAMFRRRRAR